MSDSDHRFAAARAALAAGRAAAGLGGVLGDTTHAAVPDREAVLLARTDALARRVAKIEAEQVRIRRLITTIALQLTNRSLYNDDSTEPK